MYVVLAFRRSFLLPSSEDYPEVAGSKIIRNESFIILNDGVFLRGITASRGGGGRMVTRPYSYSDNPVFESRRRGRMC